MVHVSQRHIKLLLFLFMVVCYMCRRRHWFFCQFSVKLCFCLVFCESIISQDDWSETVEDLPQYSGPVFSMFNLWLNVMFNIFTNLAECFAILNITNKRQKLKMLISLFGVTWPADLRASRSYFLIYFINIEGKKFFF